MTTRPFVFRLAAVLQVWQRREEAALANLQRQKAATAVAEQRVARLVADRDAARTQAAGAGHAVTGRHDPAWHRNWITGLAVQVEAARDDATRCAANELAAHAAWQRARRDRRVIERLADRARRRHAADERRDDRQRMDELAVFAAARREEQTW